MADALPPENPELMTLPPLWKEKAYMPRPYQWRIGSRAVTENLLVVLPTGLGKTLIAALLAVKLMARDSEKKVIMLAPTRPLIDQHEVYFRQMVNLPENAFVQLTGKVVADKRLTIFTDPALKILFMTPQTLNNDLQNHLYGLENVAGIIFDEAHHASGDYAYCPIANFFGEQNPGGRILGLTASPGAASERIVELCQLLHIPGKNIEYLDKKSNQVTPFTHKVKVVTVGVDLSELMAEVRAVFKTLLEATEFRYTELVEQYDNTLLPTNGYFGLGAAVKHQQKFILAMKGTQINPKQIRILLAVNARLIKLYNFVNNTEAQGLHVVLDTLKKMDYKIKKGTASKADLYLFQDYSVQKINHTLLRIASEEAPLLYHPKMHKLTCLLDKHFENNPGGRVLVFAKLRSTVKTLVKFLKPHKKFFPHEFVGQGKSGKDKGLTQKRQIALLGEFKRGLYNILVATVVAEEGLDIAECDLVVFYDNSGSEISLIQRSGRTGRSMAGNIIILYTKNTADERRLHISRRKRSKVKREIRKLCATGKQAPLTSLTKNTLAAQNPKRAPAPQKKSSVQILLAPDAKVAAVEIPIGIKASFLENYPLKSALPLGFSLVAYEGLFDIAVPPHKPVIGIDVLRAHDVDLDPENFSFHRLLSRKKNQAGKYLLLLDGSRLSLIHLKAAGVTIHKFRQATGIAVSIFKSPEMLAVKFKSILKKYAEKM